MPDLQLVRVKRPARHLCGADRVLRAAGMRVGRVGMPALLALVGAVGFVGCAADGETRLISREEFVEAYVALRLAALEESGGSDDTPISPEARERTLAEHGVTEEELLRFAEIKGGDVAYMKELWSDVERRMGELRLPPDMPH